MTACHTRSNSFHLSNSSVPAVSSQPSSTHILAHLLPTSESGPFASMRPSGVPFLSRAASGAGGAAEAAFRTLSDARPALQAWLVAARLHLRPAAAKTTAGASVGRAESVQQQEDAGADAEHTTPTTVASEQSTPSVTDEELDLSIVAATLRLLPRASHPLHSSRVAALHLLLQLCEILGPSHRALGMQACCIVRRERHSHAEQRHEQECRIAQ